MPYVRARQTTLDAACEASEARCIAGAGGARSSTSPSAPIEVRSRASAPVAEQRLLAAGVTLLELQSSDPATPSACSCQMEPAAPSASTLLLVSDPRATNLAHFRPSASTQRPKVLPGDYGGFTKVRSLAKAIHGEVLLYCWRRPSLDKEEERAGIPSEYEENVVVKRLNNERIEENRWKETDERSAHFDPANSPDPEDALTEIGILSHLAAQADQSEYLLRMLGVFVEGDWHTWLVTEFAEGGELFELVASGTVLAEAEVKRYVWQLLQAVAYLHKHRIGHRDVSLENVLLRRGDVRLMDFAMAVQSHSASGTALRYFRTVGKDFYRPPECYVPRPSTGATAVAVVAPPAAVAAPGDVALLQSGSALCEVKLPSDAKPGQFCTAELWGYAVQPSDVFSSGISLFIMGLQVPPWHEASLRDQSFNFVYTRGAGGIEALLQSWGKPPLSAEAMELLSDMLCPSPAGRPSASDCLEHVWFTEMEHALGTKDRLGAITRRPVPVH